MSMQQEIQEVIDRFHRNLGTESYSLKLKDAKIYYFEPGLLEDADVTVTTTPENLQGLIDGTLRPMRAYVLKKIAVKGKIDDLMFLKKLF